MRISQTLLASKLIPEDVKNGSGTLSSLVNLPQRGAKKISHAGFQNNQDKKKLNKIRVVETQPKSLKT